MLWALLASGTFSGLLGPRYPVRVLSPYISRYILTLPFLSPFSATKAALMPHAPLRLPGASHHTLAGIQIDGYPMTSLRMTRH